MQTTGRSSDLIGQRGQEWRADQTSALFATSGWKVTMLWELGTGTGLVSWGTTCTLPPVPRFVLLQTAEAVRLAVGRMALFPRDASHCGGSAVSHQSWCRPSKGRAVAAMLTPTDTPPRLKRFATRKETGDSAQQTWSLELHHPPLQPGPKRGQPALLQVPARRPSVCINI
ncbi:hypothetical protein OIDMADRAFT_176030 [Oidiodendron maius Zn]|uniref:Uncharacterized protein n=1 Tax=Oidiodendron maius (strain Zn) TaxID=913774 RepID=A0A0C3D3P3_OIDMZ|nr:hypothetical protein OIDMADRAFT_176030 [Oidiodendron maius Zn]